MAEDIWRELNTVTPTLPHLIAMFIKLLLAAGLGGILGFERQISGKEAGLRTHMLVAMGAALFVLTAMEAGVPIEDMSRVIQGVATGIGFVGAGVIVKLSGREEVRGVTTAANVWLTAAIGMAVALGHFWLAVVAAILGWFVLFVVHEIKGRLLNEHQQSD